MTTADTTLSTPVAKPGRLIVRQHLTTRLTHWIWAISLFFLLLSGLQIFDAHPSLHIGKEARLCWRAVRAVSAHRLDRSHHVARHGFVCALAARRFRRTPDGAHHPFHRHAAARRVLPHTHVHDRGGRPHQRTAFDDNRPLP